MHFWYHYDLPPTTTATEVVRHIEEDMKNSNLHYIFVDHHTLNIVAHEALPLLVLQFRHRA